MLDAIMAATEHLVVTYTGANETTGQPRPPAVPLGELLDALDDTVDGRQASTRCERHPLQAFDPRNLDAAGAVLLRPRPRSTGPGRPPARASRRAVAGRRSRCPPRDAATSSSRPLVAFFKHPVKEFLRERLEIVAARRGRGGRRRAAGRARRPAGSGASATGCCATCCAGRTPRARPSARSGGAACCHPVGSAGGSASRLVDQAAPGRRDGRRRSPRGRTRAARRRRRRPRRRTPAARHRHRPLRRPHRDGELLPARPTHLLEAWIPLLALCADPARPALVGRCDRRGAATALRRAGRPRRPSPRSTGPTDLLRDLVAIYDAGMREPLPLPLKTGHAWAVRRQPAQRLACARREFKWLVEGPVRRRERGRRARRASGVPALRSAVLLEQQPRPGEEYAGQTTRLGALACGCGRRSSSGPSDDPEPTTGALRPARPAARRAPPCSRRAPAPARPSPSGALVTRYVAEGHGHASTRCW